MDQSGTNESPTKVGFTITPPFSALNSAKPSPKAPGRVAAYPASPRLAFSFVLALARPGQ